jgi:hypothetical protein
VSIVSASAADVSSFGSLDLARIAEFTIAELANYDRLPLSLWSGC